MNPTELQIQTFIRWLEDEQPNSPLVPAAIALAELSLDRLRDEKRPLLFNRAEIAIKAGIQSGDLEKLSSADHDLARRSVDANDFKSLFNGWKDRQISWLQRFDPSTSTFIGLREVGEKTGGNGKKKLYMLVSLPISSDPIRPLDANDEAETPVGQTAEAGAHGQAAPLPALVAVIEDDWVEGEIAEIVRPQPFFLHYDMAICQQEEMSPWGKVIFKNGVVRRRTWRWLLHSGRFLLAALAVGLISLFGFILPLGGIRAFALGEFIACAVLVAYFVAFEIRPWLEVTKDRIQMASDLWLKLGDPAQIEICRIEKIAEWRLVRYTAVCPVCASCVFVEKGEPEFRRRLVGRCSESPREHVFSFDRITRRGGALICPP